MFTALPFARFPSSNSRQLLSAARRYSYYSPVGLGCGFTATASGDVDTELPAQYHLRVKYPQGQGVQAIFVEQGPQNTKAR